MFPRNKIGRNFIKESLDDLPSGICFAKSNGNIVLYNRKMDELARCIMGRDLQHISELQSALKNPSEAVKTVNAERRTYLFPDQKVWQFTESKITDEYGAEYILIATADVTELSNKEKELHRENAELEEINARAFALYSEIDQIVRDEENFALKTKIHDDLGMLLLKSRQTLTENPTIDKMRLLGLKWQNVGETLGISNGEVVDGIEFSVEKEFAELKELIKGIGLTFNVIGALPTDDSVAKLLFFAIRECSTNAVRHGEATELTAVVSVEKGGRTKAIITNNGKIPKEDITEGGGLSALRKRIERTGGIMLIESAPIFALTVVI